MEGGMLQQSRFWAIVALFATFAAGGLLGWAVGTRAQGGGPRWRAAGTRWDGWLPERAVGPHGSTARLGAGDSGATPRRLGENLAGGASALRLGALCDERGDQRPTDPGATAALRGAGASA